MYRRITYSYLYFRAHCHCRHVRARGVLNLNSITRNLRARVAAGCPRVNNSRIFYICVNNIIWSLSSSETLPGQNKPETREIVISGAHHACKNTRARASREYRAGASRPAGD